MIVPDQNVGMGYRLADLYANELRAVDLTNGKVLWDRYISRTYGWDDILFLDDSTRLIVASGLHLLNLKSGEGWDFDARTGKKKVSRAVAKNIAGAALGVLTGTFIFSGADVVSGLVSNVRMDKRGFYFASANELVKINKKSGFILWRHPFEKDILSGSELYLDEHLVYIVNKGVGFYHRQVIPSGKPFFAAYDRTTGVQKYYTLIGEPKSKVVDVAYRDKAIYCLFDDNQLRKYSKETGQLLKKKHIISERYGAAKLFAGGTIVETERDKFIDLCKSDTTSMQVWTSMGKILVINDQLYITEVIGKDDLSWALLKYKGFRFVVKKNEIWIINQEGQKIATINEMYSPFLVGKTLYGIKDDTFIAIDLSELLKDE